MPSVISEIVAWSKSLPYWEQAALDRILAGSPLVQNDYEELLDYLLEDHGLIAQKKQRLKLSHLDVTSSSIEPSGGAKCLKRIFNLQNINALVPGQTLIFGPALTAIFGENGSGKSGYARVLGCAGFSRGDKAILPNVTKPVDSNMILSADIEVGDNTKGEIIHYCVGNQCAELSQFYVFDSTSVYVHLTGSNVFSFSPAGLFILTRLSEVTDKVRECLQARIGALRQPHNFSDLFQGKSAVTDFVSALGPRTSIEELRGIATLSKDERQRMLDIDREIAALKTQDIPKQLQKLRQTIEDLEKLVANLKSIENLLNDKAIEGIRLSLHQYLQRESLSKSISVDQFKSESFTHVGSEYWYHFVVAAKALADLESSKDRQYPQINDRCLLCYRPIDEESRSLLLKLWKYLESDAQLKLDQSNRILADKRQALSSINLDFFTDQAVSYRHLHEHDINLLKVVIFFVDKCRTRRDVTIGIIDSHVDRSLTALPKNGIADINVVIEKLKEACTELENQNTANKTIDLGQELLALQHREILLRNLAKIESYVSNTKWADQASKIGGDTRHITKKYKELFEQLVTNRYLELFKSILQDLQRPINVRVKTLGRKGKTCKQIVLEIDPSVSIDLATPDKVLSEGEKRAVALADFLTEVELDTTSNSIILDDPVTSLDLEWKEAIAFILVKEAKHRQVIVFTHDLPFLYLLKKCADENSVNTLTHWIQRVDNRPGYVFPNNSPALEREYCKPTRAREFYKLAKDSVASEQEKNLRLGFGALRSCYEAFIIYELFEGVVLRFDVRVSPGRLKGIKWDDGIANEVNSKYEKLSRYIEGHLQSDGYISKPTLAMLLAEIESFEALRKKLSEIKAH